MPNKLRLSICASCAIFSKMVNDKFLDLTFAHITHPALKSFRCVAIRTNTAVPEIFFNNFRLTFPTHWRLLMVHYNQSATMIIKTDVYNHSGIKQTIPTTKTKKYVYFRLFRSFRSGVPFSNYINSQ